MPAMVMAAFVNDLNPAIDAQRRLIARWSCSIRLLRYLFVRTLTFRQHGCSLPQQPQCAPTRHMTVESHFARDAWSVRRERLAKECLCGRDSTVAAEQEIDGVAMLVHGTIR